MKRVILDFIATRFAGLGEPQELFSELHLVAKVDGRRMPIVPDVDLFRFGHIEKFDIIECEEKLSSNRLSSEEIFDVKLKNNILTVQLKVIPILEGWNLAYIPKI